MSRKGQFTEDFLSSANFLTLSATMTNSINKYNIFDLNLPEEKLES